MKDKKKISFLIEDNLFDLLQERADLECLSISALIRRILIASIEPDRMVSR